MKKTIKLIVDITMVIALLATICLTVYLLLFANKNDDGSLASEGNVQGNSTVVTRRGS